MANNLKNKPIIKRLNLSIFYAVTLVITSCFLYSCGGNAATDNSSKDDAVETKDGNSIDICRCLTEPGGTEWNKVNADACRDAISKKIGVENWEKINMSENPEVSSKFDALAKECTGSSEEGIVSKNLNSELILNIGTSNGYIWESINSEAQIYTTLAFDDLTFNTTAYTMNGMTNSEDFTKIIDLSGSWNSLDSKSAKGIMSTNGVAVSWVFSSDFSTLKNNKGVVFNRVKIN